MDARLQGPGEVAFTSEDLGLFDLPSLPVGTFRSQEAMMAGGRMCTSLGIQKYRHFSTPPPHSCLTRHKSPADPAIANNLGSKGIPH